VTTTDYSEIVFSPIGVEPDELRDNIVSLSVICFILQSMEYWFPKIDVQTNAFGYSLNHASAEFDGLLHVQQLCCVVWIWHSLHRNNFFAHMVSTSNVKHEFC
jgi:hypothetical protein